jgi:splicing factor U2AF subunit
LTSLNKAERQLYVGNIPIDIKSEPLMDFLNEKLRELGRSAGIFQDGNPIVGCWISGEGHYAFVDFRSPDEATQGFVLQQVQMKG